jgi:hypothetical protein
MAVLLMPSSNFENVFWNGNDHSTKDHWLHSEASHFGQEVNW